MAHSGVESPQRDYDCFLSYAGHDLELAVVLDRRLRALGFRIWFDKARMRPGFDWYREIEKGVLASALILPLLTPRWKASPWTRFETYGAANVLPLLCEAGHDDLAPVPIQRWQSKALDPLTATDAEYEALAADIRVRLQAASEAKPPFIANLPYPANDHFVGRETELLAICEELHRAPAAVLAQGRVRALTSLGGVGKTTLASEYAHRFWRIYSQIFWVDARQGYEAQFAGIFELINPDLADIGLTDAQKAERALQALRDRTERLLVIDNAEDEQSVQQWIPHGGFCHTLITSRFARWSAGVKVLALDVLDPDVASQFLLRRTGREKSNEDPAACDALAASLGHLPLALEQAGAYVVAEGAAFSFGDYLALYKRASASLLAAGALGSTRYPDPVITTWRATIDRLSPESRAVLRMSACMAPSPIPIAVFENSPEAVLAVAEGWGEILPPDGDGDIRMRAAIRGLTTYSMATSDGANLSIHNLVQTVELLSANDEEHELAVQASFAGIAEILPPPQFESWPLCRTLTNHIIALERQAREITSWRGRAVGMAGDYLVTQAEYEQAEPLLRQAARLCELDAGPDAPALGSYLASLAQLLEDTNRPADAEPMFRRAVALLEKSEPLDHGSLLPVLNGLALSLYGANRPAEAEQVSRRALEIAGEVCEPTDPRLLLLLNSRAVVLQGTGRLAEAEGLYRRALVIAGASALEGDPDIASVTGNLAQLLNDMGRPKEAEELSETSVATLQRALPPDHPALATARNNLGLYYMASGRSRDAEVLFRMAMDSWEKSQGPDHPNVALGLNNLAHLLFHDLNQPEEAERMYRRALQIEETSRGADHPGVARCLNNLSEIQIAARRFAEAEPYLRRAVSIWGGSGEFETAPHAKSLNNLAALLTECGRHDEAEPIYVRAIDMQGRMLGPDHPDLALSLSNFAEGLIAMKRAPEAERLLRRVLEIRERSLPADHPDVAMALQALAGILGTAGSFAEAESLYRRALSIRDESRHPVPPGGDGIFCNFAFLLGRMGQHEESEALYRRGIAVEEQRLGPVHLDLSITIENLGVLLTRVNRMNEAEELFRRVLAIREEIFGEGHPDTEATLSNLAVTLSNMGRSAEAERLYRRIEAIHEACTTTDPLDRAANMSSLAWLLVDTGRKEEGIAAYRQALEIEERELGASHRRVGLTLRNLGYVLQQSSPGHAESCYLRAISCFEADPDESQLDLAIGASMLGYFLTDLGRFPEAEAALRRGLAIRLRECGDGHENVGKSHFNLGRLFEASGRSEEAREAYAAAYRIRVLVHGEDHPETRAAGDKLSEAERRSG